MDLPLNAAHPKMALLETSFILHGLNKEGGSVDLGSTSLYEIAIQSPNGGIEGEADAFYIDGLATTEEINNISHAVAREIGMEASVVSYLLGQCSVTMNANHGRTSLT
jgi:hypothetical protein